jgi:hypothetical protein
MQSRGVPGELEQQLELSTAMNPGQQCYDRLFPAKRNFFFLFSFSLQSHSDHRGIFCFITPNIEKSL